MWAQTTFTSTGGGGNWDDGTTWDQGGSTPGSTDNVIIATGDVVTMANTGTRNITNLTLQGSGQLDWTANRRLNVSGDLTMSGTSSLTGTSNNQRIDVTGNFGITSGTATIGGIRFNEFGTTTIDGTLSFSSATGTKTFTNITVNSGGTWDNGNVTEVFNIDGSIVHNGDTWNGCSNTTGCRYTFRTNGSTISGSDTVYITDIRVNNGVTLTNNGLLVVTDNIDGATAPITGVFVNGSTGVLNLRDNGAYSELTFTLNTVGNTVIYDGTGNENITLGPFYNLTVNKPNATTRVDVNLADATVNNNLTLTRGRMRLQSANTLTVSGNLTITADSELEPNNVGAVANISGDIIMTGGLYDHNNGDVNITDDFLISGGTVTYTGTSTLDADQIIIENATMTLAGGTVNATNAGSDGITLNAAGVLIHNAATLNVTNDLNIANATAEYSPNNVSAVANISGDLLMSAGLYDHNNGDVNISRDMTFTGGTMTLNETTNPSTVDATDMTVTNTTVTLPEGTLTLSNPSGGLTINTGSIVSVTTTSTLEVTNNISISGGELTSNATGATTNVGGDIVISSGEYDHNNGDVNVTGDILISGTGLMNMGGETSTVDATDLTMTAGTANLADGTLTLSNATGGMTISGGVVNINGDHLLSITNDITISGTGEFQPNNSEAVINVGADLTMSNGTFDHNDGDLNITGDIIITGGTMTMNEATTPVNPSTIDATDMSVATGSVTLSEGTLTLSNATGGLTVSSGSFNKNNAANTLSIAGDYDISGGTNDINSGIISFVNMDITGGGTINVASPTITSTGIITVTNGTYTSDGNGGTYSYNNISVGASGSWVATSPYDPTINGNLANDGTFTGCSTTNGCNYTLTSATGTISGSSIMTSMSDFIINDGASYTNTNTGGLNITDRLATTSGTGTFINGLNGVMLYGGSTGNFSITNFTASASPNTVTYNRTSANQLIEPTTDGFYHNLTIDKADGVDVTTNTVFTINGVLTLTAGDFTMGNQNLIIADGATISGGSSTSYIQDSGTGVLRQLYSSAGATLSFPMGDADDYSPINSFTISSATFGGSPFLDFSITDADHPSRDTDNTGAGGDDDGTAAVAFISRFWTVSPSDISGPRFNASYTYVDADVTGTEASMVGTVYRTPPGEAFLDWHVAGTVNPVTNTVSITNVDAFGDLYAMDNTTDRLPIVLLSFDVRLTESTVELEWVTSSEENNDFYTIERSIDGINFSPVLTLAGAGNSEELITYNATDRSPLRGRSFYRLKQTDFNGQFEYSEIRSVFYDGSTQPFEINVYPNPVIVNSNLTIKLPSVYVTEYLQLQLIDQFGREANVDHRLVRDGLSVSTSGLKPGIYVIRLTDGSRQTRKKVIVR
ncbi:T9SS type A sorting domain-containing protein [Roseivirga sp. E12]|uniref:T9SS type A sorting domain-containing protein n=1 Tax=Roseivirga sp. E12 TaxID=2819237 RepID=UPI001ABC275E|nr:T9SS type A sorting domain-containing protein [Roseivirga sp. E12]MBO3697613.1 T9SS type A sorting domain-containing protein [Roseivirga sp. E12]